jgi:fused signal recognition particle receptor
MVFNWFRRQYNDSSDTPTEKQQGEISENSTANEAQPESAETQSEVAVDMLAFAKAAYKNIQQEPQETETTPEAPKEEVVEAPQPEVTVDTVVSLTQETEVQTSEAIVTEEGAAPSEVTAEPTVSASLSFLERAAAERQAKQERLIASAVEVPEVCAASRYNYSNGTRNLWIRL